ncbi:MAG: acylphosphatase [Abditibacteriales bacterium]|nr:acylphosphatase [Abditibacteriales bacterium]MDW8366069.1 acylphosphatase [Abditibacteriales bacterium]
MPTRARVVISGKVQGVYFRAFVRDQARTLGVNGYVRNMLDGRVEVVMEGEQEKVERLITLCRQGPPLSRVDKVDVMWEEFQGEFTTFMVRY